MMLKKKKSSVYAMSMGSDAPFAIENGSEEITFRFAIVLLQNWKWRYLHEIDLS